MQPLNQPRDQPLNQPPRDHATTEQTTRPATQPTMRHATEQTTGLPIILRHYCLEQMTPGLFDELIAFDDRCFVRPGSEFRRRLLERWTSIEGGKTVVALDSDHRIVGFGCRRPAFEKGHHLIGPLYADSFDIAWDLVAQLSNDIPDTKIWMNIWFVI